MKPLLIFIIALKLTFTSTLVFALDNPDSPDLLSELELNSKKYLDSIDRADGYRASIIAYDDYQGFLDKELNKAYEILMKSLSKNEAKMLERSQNSWLKHRELEFEFINKNWTRENFGSSSSLSRGSYKCSVLKSRLIQLLNYNKNY
ncbi:lysozyme inhibitor LprI family protein [Photobacterium sanguinicancri]|uniref:Lysozyme inhibitor LprI family protein n=1 Tax=Photobacterium sanguinicancri TaxID=875932 RepID=A0AAW7YCA9_9GAMM|nr:lysozyme inhibitor LprI family protein [Photobacterium sanguinicancri]MDO6545535.1 lysozyme inhibitor LprI family protein [Photobacterium sanguinicancri]